MNRHGPGMAAGRPAGQALDLDCAVGDVIEPYPPAGVIGQRDVEPDLLAEGVGGAP